MILKGTEFQILVWKQIAKIPFGQTRTYKQLAIAIGNQIARELLQMHVVRIPMLLRYHAIEL